MRVYPNQTKGAIVKFKYVDNDSTLEFETDNDVVVVIDDDGVQVGDWESE